MAKEKKNRRYSIKLKTITLTVALSIVVMETAIACHAIMTNKNNKETYMAIAKDISASVAQVTDVAKFKELKANVKTIVDSSTEKPIAEDHTDEELAPYYAQFNSVTDSSLFIETRDYLRTLADANADFIDCLYYCYVDTDKELFIYMVDSAAEDACPPGCIDPIYSMNKAVLSDPSVGFPPYITDTHEYGWLISAGAPVYDGNDVVGYAMADVSMLTVRKKQAGSIVRMTIYMLITILLVVVGGVIWVSLWMIRPLKKLENVAKSYDAENPKETHENFQNLHVDTNDEIADLAQSMKIMENDLYERYNKLLAINSDLVASREETKKMQMLANQDGLTGVKNKVSYNAEVERINKMIESGEKTEFAVVMIDLNYLKDTNDTFGHDTGDIALINLAKIICETFKFSPVYRIGGDEFTVISRGKDYQRIETLVDDIKLKISKIKGNSSIHNGDNISAAVGYSKFDPKLDKTVEDVFKRADKEMYINKREIKS